MSKIGVMEILTERDPRLESQSYEEENEISPLSTWLMRLKKKQKNAEAG